MIFIDAASVFTLGYLALALAGAFLLSAGLVVGIGLLLEHFHLAK